MFDFDSINFDAILDDIENEETNIDELLLDLIENYRTVITFFKKDFKNIELFEGSVKIDGTEYCLDDYKGEAKYAIDALTSSIIMIGGNVDNVLLKAQNVLNGKEDIESGYDEWRCLEKFEIDYEKTVLEIASDFEKVLSLLSLEKGKVEFLDGFGLFLLDGKRINFDCIDFSENAEVAELMCAIDKKIIAIELSGKTEDEIFCDVEKILNGEN